MYPQVNKSKPILMVFLWLIAIPVFIWSLQGKEEAEKIIFGNENFTVHLNKSNATFQVIDENGEVRLKAHPAAGILLAKERNSLFRPVKILEYKESLSAIQGTLYQEGGLKAKFTMILQNDFLQVKVWPDQLKDSLGMEIRTASMSPVYGLGDHGGYEGKTNLFGLNNDHFMNDKSKNFNWNHYRFISTFAIFPAHEVAQVIFDRGDKRITINEEENKMGVNYSSQLNAYYFFGPAKQIYLNYKRIKEREGYPDKKPKFAFFEVGYEAFGSLGWNTYQSSVQEDIDTYLEKGYPLKWAVVGSGFWKGERRKAKEGSTTSFGIWDSVPGKMRKDGLPNPRYPNVQGLKDFFKERDIRLLLGSRINFKALKEDGGHYFPENDGKFVKEGLRKEFFIKKKAGKAETFQVNFPQGNTYLLDTDQAEAVDWFVENFEKWEVDGVKEDLMLQDGVLLGNDGKLNPVNERMMDQGKMVMIRNSAYSVPGDILRLEDTKYGFDQDRTLINVLNYAYSGVGNIYPDIVAGKYLKNPLSEDEKRYFVRNAMMAAVMPVMSLGFGPWHLKDPEYEKTVKKAVEQHHKMVPYIYSEVIRGFETGFPYALTPLTLAFPKDKNTYNLGDSINRQYSWMIGESLLAAPLFGNDYASAMTRDLYLPKGKWMDWETGEVLEGGKTYYEYPFPDSKLPLFVGRKDCIILRKSNRLYAYYFPLNFTGDTFVFIFPDGQSKTTIELPSEEGSSYKLTTSKQTKMEWDKELKAYFFPIEAGENYQVRSN